MVDNSVKKCSYKDSLWKILSSNVPFSTPSYKTVAMTIDFDAMQKIKSNKNESEFKGALLFVFFDQIFNVKLLHKPTIRVILAKREPSILICFAFIQTLRTNLSNLFWYIFFISYKKNNKKNSINCSCWLLLWIVQTVWKHIYCWVVNI